MRAIWLRSFGAVMLAVLASCGGGEGRDLLMVRTPSDLAIIDPDARKVLFKASNAHPSRDWSRVFRAVNEESSTKLSALDPSTGREISSWSLEDNLAVKAVSDDGDSAVLSPPRGFTATYPQGQETTTFLIAQKYLAEPRKLELKGNYEPEAFSVDGSSLFVIEYLPPLAPDRYRVRQVDLATGKVSGVLSADGELQESMQGTARIQAMSPDGRRLYTLYSLADDDSTLGRGFVHVLSLDEKWAHCIDLPAPIGIGNDPRVTLAVSPDSSELFVADARSGRVAKIDTESLNVGKVGSFPAGQAAGAHRFDSAAGPNQSLYLARGLRVHAFDTSTMTERAAWSLPGGVVGLQAGNRNRIYAALADRIIVLDARSGKQLEVIRVPGLTEIFQMGQVARSIEAEQGAIKCAC